jgi:integrase
VDIGFGGENTGFGGGLPMTRKILSARTVQTIGDGWHHDQHGLYLQVTANGAGRSWVYRYSIGGRQKYIGLGPAHTISLATARELARECRALRLRNIDPLLERQRQKQALIAEQAKAVTFKDVAEAYLDLHLDSFRNPKHRQQWRSTLATYVYPKIGNMIIAAIEPPDVLRCIEPIWKTKHETASRVLQRITRILDYAKTRQYRTGDNPAARVAEALPKPKNGEKHHAALPYAEIPQFMAELRERDSASAKALEFTILTSARTQEVIFATKDETDLKAKVWTVPAERMKAGKEHKVPLCERAVEILQSLDQRSKRLFPLSTMAMGMLLRGMRPGITVHGFRSTFRDWAAETTNYPNHVVEMALAHAIGDKVEAAYRRGDLFVKRVKLMTTWAEYCGKAPSATSTIVSLRQFS